SLGFWVNVSPGAHGAIMWGSPIGASTYFSQLQASANRFNVFINPNYNFGLDYAPPSGFGFGDFAIGNAGYCCLIDSWPPDWSGVGLSTGTWTYLTIVRSGNTYTVYVKGYPVASATDSSP